MRDPFARATQSILGLLGKDALLRGAPAGKVNLEHGVEVYEKHNEGESVFTRTVATIDKSFMPKRGDPLTILDELGAVVANYRIEGVYADNGYTVRHVVLPL